MRGTVTGRYMKTFAEADMFMLDGVSLNAPYEFFWGDLIAVETNHIVCTGAGKEMRLPYRSTGRGDRATIVVQDPIFGPTKYEVHPFLQEGGTPVGDRQRELAL
jgi:hypothetical protein